MAGRVRVWGLGSVAVPTNSMYEAICMIRGEAQQALSKQESAYFDDLLLT